MPRAEYKIERLNPAAMELGLQNGCRCIPCATHLLEAKVDIHVIQVLLGHKKTGDDRHLCQRGDRAAS